MARMHGWVMAGLLLANSMAAGCGEVSPVTGALSVSGATDATAGSEPTTVEAGRRGPGGFGGGHFGPMGFGMAFGADVSLTDDQKAQLKAIADKYKPATPPTNDVKTLLEAETVDAAALRTALEATETARAQHEQDRWAMMAEIRAVYTDEQRAQIVTKLQAQTEPPVSPADGKTPPADGASRLTDKLQLTDEQKAAVDALRPQSATKPDFAARQAAMIAFWQTGDTSALQALPQPPHPSVDAMINAATVLTAAQRKAIFGRLAMGPGHGRGPGGRPSGDQGFGGRPGGQGHGGRPGGFPRPEASPSDATV